MSLANQKKIGLRALIVSALALSTIVPGQSSQAAISDATPCATSGVHCYALASRITSGIASAHLWEDQDSLWADTQTYPYAHINSEMWILMDDGSYIEAGIRFGDGSQYLDHPCTGICYAVFWDETRNGVQLKHIISQSAAGNPRIELAIGQYQGHWIIKLNGTQVGTAGMVSRLTTQRIDV